MRKIQHTILLYTIIIIEGYVVLSTELLAIRQTIPYVGSGTDTVSIIIAAVLMPLAFGYQNGGKFRPKKCCGQFLSIRKKLISNIIIAALILLPGMSALFISWFFPYLGSIGLDNRIIQTSVYSVLFIVVPVYLLGQTIPLVSNYFSSQKLAKVTGHMLFFSTLGSFMGAVFSTLVLMSTIGVHNTVTINFILLSVLIILLSKKKTGMEVLTTLAITLIAIAVNSNGLMTAGNNPMAKDGGFRTEKLILKDNARYILLNSDRLKPYDSYGRKAPYIEFFEKVAIDPIIISEKPRDILVIGSGSFILGIEDRRNIYSFVDLDEKLLDKAKDLITKEKIGDNKKFLTEPAREFLSNIIKKGKKFDVVFLDSHIGGATIPERLLTQEFFRQIKDVMKDKAIMMASFILSPTFNNPAARNVDNTLRSVFPNLSRVVVNGNVNLWDSDPNILADVVYIYRHENNYVNGTVYTDDKNTVFYDKPKKLGK